MRAKSASFRIGKVRAYRRGRVWYLYYHEQASVTARASDPIGKPPVNLRLKSTLNWKRRSGSLELATHLPSRPA